MVHAIDIDVKQVEKSRIQEIDFQHIEFAKVYSDHMFLCDYREGEWTDLRIEPYKNIELSPANPAIHYGVSIFEGLKAYKHNDGVVSVFRPQANAKRMNSSAERLVMPAIPEEIFMEGMHKLLDLDRNWVPDVDGTSLYIRPFMFATDEFIGVKPASKFRFMIITCPVGAYYSRPVRVKIEEHYTRAVKGGTGFAKTAGNYAASLYPAKLAQEKGYDQLIWTDGQFHKYIEESGTMNVMFVIDDVLITAPTGDTILNGITRDSVLKLAEYWRLNVEVRPIEVEELLSAIEKGRLNEAFGVGTAATIAHIAQIGYQDQDFSLPPLGEDAISTKIMNSLTAIRQGTTDDLFGWNYKI